MKNSEKSERACNSVFKSGESTTTTSRFTGKWIELINIIEKNKGITTVRRS